VDLPTYTNIWRIEKRLYKLYDVRLPMPLPINWIAVFAGITIPYIILLIAIGLPFNHSLVWLYVLPPGLLTWLTTRPVIENKRLPELVESQVRYLTEPRTWVRFAPLSEKDQMIVTARVWRSRPPRRPARQAPGKRPVSAPGSAPPAVAPARESRPVHNGPVLKPTSVFRPEPAAAPGLAVRQRQGAGAQQRSRAQELSRSQERVQERPRGTAGRDTARRAPMLPAMPDVVPVAAAPSPPPAQAPVTPSVPAPPPTQAPRPARVVVPVPAAKPDKPPVRIRAGAPGGASLELSHDGPGRRPEPAGQPAEPGAPVWPSQPLHAPARPLRPITPTADIAEPQDAEAGQHQDAAATAQEPAEALAAPVETPPAPPALLQTPPVLLEVPPAPPETPSPQQVAEPRRQAVPSIERALSGPGRDMSSSWGGKVKVVTGNGAAQGPGARDQEAQDRNRARLPLADPRRILVLGCTSGAGQSVTAYMTAFMLASLREHPVAAVDLHDGALARFRAPAAWLEELLAGKPPQHIVSGRPDGLHPSAKQNPARLDVVASHETLADGDEIKLSVQLNRHYPLTVLDTGAAGLTRLLKVTDQLVVVVPANGDAAAALADTRDWLDNNGHADLAMQSVTVINGVSRRSLPDVEQAESVARGRSRAIVRVPWDDMLPLAAAGPSSLRPQTRVAYTALSGVLVAGLAAAPARTKQ
jgi:TcpE family